MRYLSHKLKLLFITLTLTSCSSAQAVSVTPSIEPSIIPSVNPSMEPSVIESQETSTSQISIVPSILPSLEPSIEPSEDISETTSEEESSIYSEIIAKPTYYNDCLLDVLSGEELEKNFYRIVCDYYRNHDLSRDLLDSLIYLASIDIYGAFNKQVKTPGYDYNRDAFITLSEAVFTSDINVKTEFIKAHKYYWDDTRNEDVEKQVSESEIARLYSTYDRISKAYAEKMYEMISNGYYDDRYIFSEKEFLYSLRITNADVADPNYIETPTYNCLITPDVDPQDVFDHYLHLENYMSEDRTYIVDRIIPQVYKDLLVEYYITHSQFWSIHGSHARKINVISFPEIEDYPQANFYLAKELINDITCNPNDFHYDNLKSRFMQYSKASIGVIENDDSAVQDILSRNDYFTRVYGNEEYEEVPTYYRGTEFGNICDNYLSMKNGNDEYFEKLFTNYNSYPSYIGLELYKRELLKHCNVFSGWINKNYVPTSLPQNILEVLLMDTTADGVMESIEEKACMERIFIGGHWKEGENEHPYVCRINGHNFLKKSYRIPGDTIDNDILHYDAYSKSYYIIEILEAVNQFKFDDLKAKRSEYEAENIINDIAHSLLTIKNYDSEIAKELFNNYFIMFHDEKVYEYFMDLYQQYINA